MERQSINELSQIVRSVLLFIAVLYLFSAGTPDIIDALVGLLGRVG